MQPAQGKLFTAPHDQSQGKDVQEVTNAGRETFSPPAKDSLNIAQRFSVMDAFSQLSYEVGSFLLLIFEKGKSDVISIPSV